MQLEIPPFFGGLHLAIMWCNNILKSFFAVKKPATLEVSQLKKDVVVSPPERRSRVGGVAPRHE